MKHTLSTCLTATRAGQLQLFHGDPADRMIVATAIENATTLMMADGKGSSLPLTLDV